ncbi:MAG TPA: NAD(P)/FAD-dependent oxidoreductase [Polyangiaceae bacterium]|nr:NAD(P)/FAD-dependent oxidoreductase [Polyangiaceae bacterium]
MSALGTSPGPEIAIIGGGFAGLCMGMLLKRAGIDRFTIFEKGSRLGGTWRDNAYPGAACDVPSLAYCFSFEPKVDWSRLWAPQREILSYIDDCAEKWDLQRHVRLGVEIAKAEFDGSAARWRLQTATGEQISADVVVSAVGQLNRPSTPHVPGIEGFAGTTFHSARWPEGRSLEGERVAVVGNAASAVQIVPAIAPRVRSLHVFQRSANWLLPKNDRALSSIERSTFLAVPPAARLARWLTWSEQEARFPLIRKNWLMARVATWMATRHLEEQVADPVLRRQLTPDYAIGAKRILISDDYYPALQRPNVKLVTSPLERATRDGLVTRDGQSIAVDAIVFATGFDSTAFLAPMHVAGSHGRLLADAWRGGARGYLGISVAGFPNLFLLYGPNTNLGHNSILFMLECQSRYVVACLQEMTRRGLASMDVREDVQAEYDLGVQEALAKTVWCDVDRSWYRHASGRITNNWPHSTISYFMRTRRVVLGRYQLHPRSTRSNEISAAPARHDRL